MYQFNLDGIDARVRNSGEWLQQLFGWGTMAEWLQKPGSLRDVQERLVTVEAETGYTCDPTAIKQLGFWEETEFRYDKPFHGSVNKQTYYLYLNADGKLFPQEAVQGYRDYLSLEWNRNEFESYASNNDPYGWGDSWMGENFAQWLESERTGMIHKRNFS